MLILLLTKQNSKQYWPAYEATNFCLSVGFHRYVGIPVKPYISFFSSYIYNLP